MAAMARISSVALGLLLLTSCVTLCASESSLRGALRHAQSSVLVELAGKFTHTNGSLRLDAMEKALEISFKVLPKNEHGRVEHSVARYALHRFFLQRRSWHVRGLDPNSDFMNKTVSAPIGSNLNFDYERVPVLPTLLQNSIESQHAGIGLSLQELAALAASIEDLAHTEALHRLRQIYQALRLPTDSSLSAVDAERAVKTYFASYLEGSNWKNWSSETILDETSFMMSTTRWLEVVPWIDQVRNNVSQMLSPHPDGRQAFNDTAHVIETLGESIGRFNEPECLGLKHVLVSMEGRKAGRVRLSDFYNRSDWGDFDFDEKIDYLRDVGALDESNVSDPQVIIVNYVLLPISCLQPSSLYHVCCRNECEDLMLALESAVGAPEVGPGRLAELVAGLASDSVEPRERLSDKLQRRLFEIAQDRGGKVPLYGNKFALWMHHAFPRECPFPHRPGTVNPQTPDEWMQSTGQTTQSASKAEMMEYIQPEDSCSMHEEPDLPWLDDTEPFWEGVPAKLHSSSSVVEATSMWSEGFLLCVVVVVAGLLHSRRSSSKAIDLDARMF